jgi:hypothetical protein
MKYKLRMTPDEVIANAVNAVKHLRSMGCTDIEFSPEDAGRWLGGWVLKVGGWWLNTGCGCCVAGSSMGVSINLCWVREHAKQEHPRLAPCMVEYLLTIWCFLLAPHPTPFRPL